MGDSELIRQPYRITMAIHKMTVMQKRILTQIVKVLQADMGRIERGMPLQQLDLFINAQLETVVISIPKASLVLNSNNYTKVKAALMGMMGDPEEMILPATNGKEKTTVTVLTRFIERYKWDTHSKEIKVYMFEGMARELLKITGGYTKFSESVMMQTNNTYTQRLYEFICHWRDKPVISLPVSQFREWLRLTDVYPDTWKLIQKVIKPAQKELKEIADIYFEYSSTKVAGVITHLNFIPKIRLTLEETAIETQKKQEWITNVLRIAFQFKEKHFAQVAHLILPAHFPAIEQKLEYLNDFIRKAQNEAKNGHRDRIGSVPDYVVKALQDEINAVSAV